LDRAIALAERIGPRVPEPLKGPLCRGPRREATFAAALFGQNRAARSGHGAAFDFWDFMKSSPFRKTPQSARTAPSIRHKISSWPCPPRGRREAASLCPGSNVPRGKVPERHRRCGRVDATRVDATRVDATGSVRQGSMRRCLMRLRPRFQGPASKAPLPGSRDNNPWHGARGLSPVTRTPRPK